ncbi:response regulator transcription factor [Paraburkholderia sp. BCC1884]|uniref:response regulator n=1 Tax=Paraburkholderia sp. BCC1884 TaxID=2562668 RepID=UPI001183ADDF|nr:response regulator transcription factor [Paraburkholderia sp. BCC1884]
MRVLIVDDHELFRAGLALLLTELFPQIELLHASTLAQGMSHARCELLNIVFLDLDLPDGHGSNALAELKESRPSLPVIVIAADDRVETISRCIQLRAMGYVPKSSPPEALRAAISAVLAGGVFLPASSMASLSRDRDTDEARPNGPDNRQPHI